MTTWQTLSSMLHLIAIAMWLGAIVFFLVVSGPAVNELAPKLALKTMNRARIGLEAISWFAIGLLLLTGIVNLLARLAMPPPTHRRIFRHRLRREVVPLRRDARTPLPASLQIRADDRASDRAIAAKLRCLARTSANLLAPLVSFVKN